MEDQKRETRLGYKLLLIPFLIVVVIILVMLLIVSANGTRSENVKRKSFFYEHKEVFLG